MAILNKTKIFSSFDTPHSAIVREDDIWKHYKGKLTDFTFWYINIHNELVVVDSTDFKPLLENYTEEKIYDVLCYWNIKELKNKDTKRIQRKIMDDLILLQTARRRG